MKKRVLIVCLLLIVSGASVFAQSAGQGEESSAGVLKYFAAALAVGISCLAGGIALGKIGAAAMGAMSENPDLAGKAMPYAGLAEGVCLWGFLAAILIIFL